MMSDFQSLLVAKCIILKRVVYIYNKFNDSKIRRMHIYIQTFGFKCFATKLKSTQAETQLIVSYLDNDLEVTTYFLFEFYSTTDD